MNEKRKLISELLKFSYKMRAGNFYRIQIYICFCFYILKNQVDGNCSSYKIFHFKIKSQLIVCSMNWLPPFLLFQRISRPYLGVCLRSSKNVMYVNLIVIESLNGRFRKQAVSIGWDHRKGTIETSSTASYCIRATTPVLLN